MKRSHVLAIAFACFSLGIAVAHFGTTRIQAQNTAPQFGRYQLFQGRYFSSNNSSGAEFPGVFRIDTVTGKADSYLIGTTREGKFIESWQPIQ